MESIGLGIIFGGIIALLLALDLGILHRRARALSLREAAGWSALWVAIALAFAAGVFRWRGHGDGVEFLAGYVIELSLSVDNVFLFAVIFRSFRVPEAQQHRCLVWGILSAVVLRGVMIAAGTKLIQSVHNILLLFGAFLIYTGVKMFLGRNSDHEMSENRLVKFVRRVLPLHDKFEGQQFFTRINGRRYATLLLLVLVLVESTDVLFALDSIPAVFGITDDGFIVFTSNILAILGLRSLYFLLAGSIALFRYLTVGLSAVLIFVGVKMLGVLPVTTMQSLVVIAAILALSIAASVLRR